MNSISDILIKNSSNIESMQQQDSSSGISVFKNLLLDSIDNINSFDKTYKAEESDFLEGKRSDIQNIIVDAQKDSLNFSLAVQIRDKIVEAMQEIWRMQM